MPYRNGNIPRNATVWTEEMISSLKENFYTKTNKELAEMLGLRLTVTRNKCAELGLKRMTLEYWSDEMIEYLKDNYECKGDVEIMEHFKNHYPKKKGWKRKAIWKKRRQMGLLRSEEQTKKIIRMNASPGGRSFTIDKNSCSKNMHPSWVAQRLAWRDKEMQQEMMKDPGLIEIGKALIKLKRTIKDAKKKKII